MKNVKKKKTKAKVSGGKMTAVVLVQFWSLKC